MVACQGAEWASYSSVKEDAYGVLESIMSTVGGFMADLAGRRSVLFPKIQREAGKKNQRYEIFGEESSLCEVLVW